VNALPSFSRGGLEVGAASLPPPLGEGWGGGTRAEDLVFGEGVGARAPLPASPQKGEEQDTAFPRSGEEQDPSER
jgi:hypothetical protein